MTYLTAGVCVEREGRRFICYGGDDANGASLSDGKALPVQGYLRGFILYNLGKTLWGECSGRYVFINKDEFRRWLAENGGHYCQDHWHSICNSIFSLQKLRDNHPSVAIGTARKEAIKLAFAKSQCQNHDCVTWWSSLQAEWRHTAPQRYLALSWLQERRYSEALSLLDLSDKTLNALLALWEADEKNKYLQVVLNNYARHFDSRSEGLAKVPVLQPDETLGDNDPLLYFLTLLTMWQLCRQQGRFTDATQWLNKIILTNSDIGFVRNTVALCFQLKLLYSHSHSSSAPQQLQAIEQAERKIAEMKRDHIHGKDVIPAFFALRGSGSFLADIAEEVASLRAGSADGARTAPQRYISSPLLIGLGQSNGYGEALSHIDGLARQGAYFSALSLTREALRNASDVATVKTLKRLLDKLPATPDCQRCDNVAHYWAFVRGLYYWLKKGPESLQQYSQPSTEGHLLTDLLGCLYNRTPYPPQTEPGTTLSDDQRLLVTSINNVVTLFSVEPRQLSSCPEPVTLDLLFPPLFDYPPEFLHRRALYLLLNGVPFESYYQDAREALMAWELIDNQLGSRLLDQYSKQHPELEGPLMILKAERARNLNNLSLANAIYQSLADKGSLERTSPSFKAFAYASWAYCRFFHEQSADAYSFLNIASSLKPQYQGVAFVREYIELQGSRGS